MAQLYFSAFLFMTVFIRLVIGQDCTDVSLYTQAATTTKEVNKTASGAWAMSDFFVKDASCSNWAATSCSLATVSGSKCGSMSSVDSAGALTYSTSGCSWHTTGTVTLSCVDASGRSITSNSFTLTVVDCTDVDHYTLVQYPTLNWNIVESMPLDLGDFFTKHPFCPYFHFSGCWENIPCTYPTTASSWSNTKSNFFLVDRGSCNDGDIQNDAKFNCRSARTGSTLYTLPFVLKFRDCQCTLSGSVASGYSKYYVQGVAANDFNVITGLSASCSGSSCQSPAKIVMEYPYDTAYSASWPFIFDAAAGTVTTTDSTITASTSFPFRIRATDSNTTTTAVSAYKTSTLTLEVVNCADMTKITNVASPFAKSHVETTATSTVSWSLADFFNINAVCTTQWPITSCSINTVSGSPCTAGSFSSFLATGSMTFNYAACSSQTGSATLSCSDGTTTITSNAFTLTTVDCTDVSQYGQVSGLATKEYDQVATATSTAWSMSEFFTKDASCTDWMATSCTLMPGAGACSVGSLAVTTASTGALAYTYTACTVSTGSAYVRCSDASGRTRDSASFTLTIKCSLVSTVVSAPTALQTADTLIYVIDGAQPTLTLETFKSTNTLCPIIAYYLEAADSSKELALQAPTDPNIILSKSPLFSKVGTYTFKLRGVAEGLAQAYSAVMTWKVLSPCFYDVISLNKASPSKFEDLYKSYQTVASYPRLVLQQEGGEVSADITGRFTHTISSCPFSNYRIAFVLDQFDQQLSPTTQLQIYSLSIKGQLKIKGGSQVIKNHKVYVEAFNGFIWGGNSTYLVDFSYKPKIITIEKMERSMNFTVDMANFKEGENVYKLRVPDITPNDVQKYDYANKKVPFANFVKVGLTRYEMQFDVRQIFKTGTYKAGLKVFFTNFTDAEIQINIKVIDSRRETNLVGTTKAKIKSISVFGEVNITFSDEMQAPQNISWLNSSTMDLYLDLSYARLKEEGFNLSSVNFTWSTKEFGPKYMIIDINFFSPISISPWIEQDKLVVNFNNTMRTKQGGALAKESHVLKSPIRKQMEKSEANKNFLDSSESSQQTLLILLLVVLSIQLVAGGESKIFLLMTRALQLILFLPILRVAFPANAMSFIELMLSIATFDFMENFVDWEAQSFILFNEQADELDANVISQISNAGFETSNAVMNLNTVAVIIIFLLARVIISMIFLLFWMCFRERCQRLYDWAYKLAGTIFMNSLMGLTIETYMDLVVVAILGRHQLIDFWLESGEILSQVCLIISVILLVLILPYGLIRLLYIGPDKEVLESEKFKDTWGVFIEDMRTKSRFQLSYYAVFCLRRFTFLMLGMAILEDEHAWAQIIGTMLLNLFSTIYIGLAGAWQIPWYTRLELVNDWFVAACTFHMICFTDFVPKLETQWEIGWSLIIFIAVLITYNLGIVLYWFCYHIPLWILYFCILAKYYICKDELKPTPEPKAEADFSDMQQPSEDTLNRTRKLNEILSNYKQRNKISKKKPKLGRSNQMSIIQECHEEASVRDVVHFELEADDKLTGKDLRKSLIETTGEKRPLLKRFCDFYIRNMHLLEYGLHEVKDQKSFSQTTGMMIDVEDLLPNDHESRLPLSVLHLKKAGITCIVLRNYLALKKLYDKDYDKVFAEFQRDLHETLEM